MRQLESLSLQDRARVAHWEANRVAESGDTQSWDLLSFDSAHRTISRDAFHFDGAFALAGVATLEFIAITHEIVLEGSWHGDPCRGIWRIQARSAESFLVNDEQAPEGRPRYFGHA